MEATQRYGRIVSINHRFNFLAVVFFKLDMHLNSNIGKRYVVLSNQIYGCNFYIDVTFTDVACQYRGRQDVDLIKLFVDYNSVVSFIKCNLYPVVTV